MTHLDDLPPVRTQADLHLLWTTLMGPLGFGQRSLWIHFLDGDGRSTPLVQQIENLPHTPDESSLARLVHYCSVVAESAVPGGSVAFLYARPGRAGLTDQDRAWATGLTEASRGTLEAWPVHLANDQELRVFTPDDLADSA